jgi:hypothetical protein
MEVVVSLTPLPLYIVEKIPRYWVQDWLGPRAGLDAVLMEISAPVGN